MNRLKFLRQEKNKLQSDIAKILGVSDRAIGNYENGKRDMSPETIIKLANYFNVSTDFLLGKTDVRNNNIDNNEKQFYMCPVYNQFNPKENPNWETDSIQGRIPLDVKMFNISNHENCFFIKINYDSMNYVVKNGQYALIQKQSTYDENDIILIAGPMFGKVILRKCIQIKDNIVLLATECDRTELAMIDINVEPLTVIGKFIGKIEINQQNT